MSFDARRWVRLGRTRDAEQIANVVTNSPEHTVDAAPLPSNPSIWWCICTLAAACGVLVFALADRASREGADSKSALYWIALILMVLPTALRLSAPDARRGERLGLVAILGLAMYLAKVCYSPSLLVFSDEFVHVRSVYEALHTGHLFSFNPLLPVAARYPGIGVLAGTLSAITGLPIATTGLICIGAARLILMISLFLIAERLSGSSRAAGLACLIYVANPNFLYWSAQFSYESVALPLVLFSVYLVIERAAAGPNRYLSAATGLTMFAVVITHHLSAYALGLALIVWCVAAAIVRRRTGRPVYAPVVPAGLLIAAAVAWLAFAAPITIHYLTNIQSVARQGIVNVITGQTKQRGLFSASGGTPPDWVRALSFLSVGILIIGIFTAIPFVWRRRNRVALVLALGVAVLFPILLPLRFVGGANETATRSTEFVYVGVGVVVAAGFAETWLGSRSRRGLKLALAGIIGTIVVLGGIAAGWQYDERLPPDDSARGVPFEPDAQEVAAAQWSRTDLGPGQRFASDAVDRLSLAALGGQRTLWAPTDHASAWQIFLPPTVTPAVQRAIREGHVKYLLVERRLSEGVPDSGYYFDIGEPGSSHRVTPIPAATLAKFDHAPGFARIFDSGHVQIYRVEPRG
ncbi:MAG TPA: hypothetical protein VHX62_02705 [Solirubrobacteraceae bacterium]|nr:hypothetical protein [Solirubrobacteraceae bacterium]